MNIKVVYLNGDVKEEIYIKQHAGFEFHMCKQL